MNIKLNDRIPAGFIQIQRTFFEADTALVAQKLLGTYIGHYIHNTLVAGMIVETEAYYGDQDPASHAFRRKTPRNQVMFGPAGYTYVYFSYGNHYLLNIVTEKEHVPGAVLIRALEPAFGLDSMRHNRHNRKDHDLTNGPAKLTQALGINKKHNNLNIDDSDVVVFAPEHPTQQQYSIETSSRIGISRGNHLDLRFYLSGHPCVSKTPRA